MSDLLQIKEHPDYVKDTKSKAILNNNVKLLAERKKEQLIEQNISKLSVEVADLKSEMTSIQELLKILINKSN